MSDVPSETLSSDKAVMIHQLRDWLNITDPDVMRELHRISGETNDSETRRATVAAVLWAAAEDARKEKHHPQHTPAYFFKKALMARRSDDRVRWEQDRALKELKTHNYQGNKNNALSDSQVAHGAIDALKAYTDSGRHHHKAGVPAALEALPLKERAAVWWSAKTRKETGEREYLDRLIDDALEHNGTEVVHKTAEQYVAEAFTDYQDPARKAQMDTAVEEAVRIGKRANRKSEPKSYEDAIRIARAALSPRHIEEQDASLGV